jgi:hypothetical protein
MRRIPNKKHMVLLFYSGIWCAHVQDEAAGSLGCRR